MFINQSIYALEMIKKYGMESSDPVDTPMVERTKLDKDLQEIPVDPTRYRSMCMVPRRQISQLVIEETEENYYLNYRGRIHLPIWILCPNVMDEITADRLWTCIQ
ncbi:hypothetical protein Tco_1441260 [Tanacetum coccineum]